MKQKIVNFGAVKKELSATVRHAASLRLWAISAILFFLLYTFFYGVYTIPFLELGFLRVEPLSLTDIAFLAAAPILSGLVVALLRHRATSRSKGLLGGSIAGSAFGVFCPACLGTNLLLFGSVIAIPVASIIPFLPAIQLLTIIFLVGSILFAARSTRVCPLPPVAALHVPASSSLVFSRSHTLVLAVLLVGMASILVQSVFAVGSIAPVSVAPDTDTEKLIAQVLPEAGFTLPVRWGDSIRKMVEEKIIVPDKLEAVLRRYSQALTPEWKALLNGQDAPLTIDAKNSVFMMYVLWVLAKHSDNPILLNSPFASSFGPNYDIGVGRPGYGDTALITLTPEQQARATRVAENAYRPCCGQPTSRPDCSHGFSALGLVQLMASQDFSEEEMFDAVVKVNSFWFPATYIQTALYFKATENQDWEDVDKELVAGPQFSSLSGAYNVKKALQQAGY